MKRLLSAVLAAACTLALYTAPALAKTISSVQADNIFFYATNREGKSVLLKVMTLDELKAISHGQAGGENYYISATDNYPTTQYCEGRGFTVQELVDYVKSGATVQGADAISFSGDDALYLMSTDSYGNYSRSWTYNELYGQKRYYFEGLYDSEIGWNTGWEIAGESDSKFGVTLEKYNSTYKDSDPYYADKRAVFEDGVETTVILMTESYSGRTTSETLMASTEPGIAGYIRDNGGTVEGSLKNVLDDECALRLTLPITEADLMSAHRTAYDNFKWICNLKLDMVNAPPIVSQGTVAEPVPSFILSGNTLTISFTCATAGASIYYGWNGAPQTLYTGPTQVDVTGRDLDSDPVTVYAATVKEGWDDAGVLTFKYPGMAPGFKTVYSGMTNSSLTFAAVDSVSAAEWTAWTKALNFISLKAPSASGYVTLDKSKYQINNSEQTITFDAALFADTGSYSFIFHNTKYANKSVSVTMKNAVPALCAAKSTAFGQPVTVTFADDSYAKSLSVYVTPAGGTRTMISSTYLDRTQAGQVTVKAEYFTAGSTAMGHAGIYTLELVNNGYSPASQTVTLTLHFTDVAPDAWYADYVNDLAGEGIINGVGGGRFNPDGTLSWGEALKLLMLACCYEEQAPTSAHWASGYLDRAAADGLIVGEVDADAKISRLEFCQTAAKFLNAGTTLTASPFPDTNDPGVLALYELGVINGMGDGRFEPEGTLIRSQISAIIWRILNLEGTG